jgi:hypothetical protein
LVAGHHGVAQRPFHNPTQSNKHETWQYRGERTTNKRVEAGGKSLENQTVTIVSWRQKHTPGQDILETADRRHDSLYLAVPVFRVNVDS